MSSAAMPVFRQRFVWLLVVLAIAAVLVLTDEPSAPDVVPAVARAPAASVPPGVVATGARPDPSNARPQAPLLVTALRLRTASPVVQDVFAARSWRKAAALSAAPPVLPMVVEAPALPFTFLGKQLREGRWEVFLGIQERTLVVKERDTLDGVWRIETVRPPTMQVLHLPTGQQRTLQIGEGS